MGEFITLVLWNIARNYGAEIVNFTEQIVDQLETELVTDGFLTSDQVANLNTYLKLIFPGFFNLGATNTGATNTGATNTGATNTGATTGGGTTTIVTSGRNIIIPTPGSRNITIPLSSINSYLNKLYNSISNTKLYNDFYNQLKNVYNNGAFIYLPKDVINYILVNFPPTNTSTPYTSSATTTGGAIDSNNSNSILNNTQGLMKALLTDIVTKYSNVSTNFVTGISDVIHKISRSNTDSETVLRSVAGMSQAANLGLGAGAVPGLPAGGYAKGDTNTTPYSEADELNETLQETNSLIYIIFFKNYDCESSYSKQLALINLFTGLKNVIDHYKDYIKEYPNPLISKYLTKMEDVLPSIDPSDSKNRLSKDQFIAIAAILMIINYMLCYTSGLDATQEWATKAF